MKLALILLNILLTCSTLPAQVSMSQKVDVKGISDLKQQDVVELWSYVNKVSDTLSMSMRPTQGKEILLFDQWNPPYGHLNIHFWLIRASDSGIEYRKLTIGHIFSPVASPVLTMNASDERFLNVKFLLDQILEGGFVQEGVKYKEESNDKRRKKKHSMTDITGETIAFFIRSNGQMESALFSLGSSEFRSDDNNFPDPKISDLIKEIQLWL